MVVIVSHRQSDGHEDLPCLVQDRSLIRERNYSHVFYLPSIDQMTQTIIIVGQSGLWSPEVQELNIFGRVEGLIRIRAVKHKIGVLIVAEACPPKLDHRLSSDSTDRTISLDAPLDKFNYSVVSHTCL
jgi:hypothetical protein